MRHSMTNSHPPTAPFRALRSRLGSAFGRTRSVAVSRRARSALVFLLSHLFVGCARPVQLVESAFPVASQASPWILVNRVWSGPAADAAQAIGDDWARIRGHEPLQAWLAVYQHESLAKQTITVRGFRFPSADRARNALDELRPHHAEPFDIGDGGRWTDFGLLFVRGDLLFEFFGNDAEWQPAWQCAFLAGIIERRLPNAASGATP